MIHNTSLYVLPWARRRWALEASEKTTKTGLCREGSGLPEQPSQMKALCRDTKRSGHVHFGMDLVILPLQFF